MVREENTYSEVDVDEEQEPEVEETDLCERLADSSLMAERQRKKTEGIIRLKREIERLDVRMADVRVELEFLLATPIDEVLLDQPDLFVNTEHYKALCLMRGL
jgi:hypothetical protein